MQQTPSSSRNVTQNPELTPVHRFSRRIRGLSPEFVPHSTSTSTGMENTVAVTASPTAGAAAAPTAAPAAAPTHYTLQKPRVPSPFRGGLYEDVEDWLAEYEYVADFNGWDEVAKLKNVYFSLLDGARTWFQNRKGLLTSWHEFCHRLRETYSSLDRRERAERALQSRMQMPNEGVATYVEDMVHLFTRADPTMPEDKKLRHLMRGVKEQLFAGLIRSPPRTVAEFLTEAVAMEKALQQRNQYDRQVNATYTTGLGSFPTDVGALRELIRSVVRDELQQLQQLNQAQQQPSTNCIATIIRDEVQHALGTPRRETPTQVAAPLQAFATSSEPLGVTYADVLRRTVPSSTTPSPVSGFQRTTYTDTFEHNAPAPVPLPAATPYATLQSAQVVPYFADTRPVMRKSDIWRMPDRRPLCYHCGEAGHLYRDCQYRRLGLQGFPANSPRPRFGQRPPEIEDFIARQNVPLRRQSRSPSPRSSSYSGNGNRRPQGRSPSPRLEN